MFDENGAVVASVNSTESIYYRVRKGRQEDLQMVFKDCVPVRSIRDLVRP